MNKTSVMGVGFIGGAYCRAYPEETIPEPRDTLVPSRQDVLYLRSTTHNYWPKQGDLHKDIDTNLTHLMNVLPHVQGTFNYISSWFIYSGGRPTNCVRGASEWEFGRPLGYYAATKLCAETLVESYASTISGQPFRILRLCNVIGNDSRAGKQKNALEYLLKTVVRNEPVFIYDGDNYRNYLHVTDVCRAIHRCLSREDTLNGITNIGAPQSVPLLDLIEHAKARVGSTSVIARVPVPYFHRAVQTSNFWMDTTKIQSLGFTPSMTAFQAVDRVLEGILRQEALDRVSAYTDHIQHAP